MNKIIASIILVSILLLFQTNVDSMVSNVESDLWFRVKIVVRGQYDRNDSIYVILFDNSSWPFPDNIEIDPFKIYVTLENGTLLHSYIAWFDQRNRVAEIWVRGPISKNDLTLYINYNESLYPSREFLDPSNIFTIYYLLPQTFNLNEWNIVNGDPGKARLTVSNFSITMFIERTDDNVLALAYRKPFHPPLGVYLVFDPSYIEDSERGLDSVFGLIDNNNIPPHYVPYLSSLANGYVFEVMDHIWPQIRFVYNKSVYITNTGNEGALGLQGKMSILGIINKDSSTWRIRDATKSRIIYHDKQPPSILYPVFYIKGNFAYPSGLKIYFMGLFDITLYIPITVISAELEEAHKPTIEKTITTTTLLEAPTQTTQQTTTSTTPITNTTTTTFKFNLAEIKLFNINKDTWIAIAIGSFTIFILGIILGIIIKKRTQ